MAQPRSLLEWLKDVLRVQAVREYLKESGVGDLTLSLTEEGGIPPSPFVIIGAYEVLNSDAGQDEASRRLLAEFIELADSRSEDVSGGTIPVQMVFFTTVGGYAVFDLWGRAVGLARQAPFVAQAAFYGEVLTLAQRYFGDKEGQHF